MSHSLTRPESRVVRTYSDGLATVGTYWDECTDDEGFSDYPCPTGRTIEEA